LSSDKTIGFCPPSAEQFITIIATNPFNNLKLCQVRHAKPLLKHLAPRRTVWLWILDVVQPPAAQFWTNSAQPSGDRVTIPLTLCLSPFPPVHTSHKIAHGEV
jgi:hypothetical protein